MQRDATRFIMLSGERSVREPPRNFVKNDFGERARESKRFGCDSLVVKGLIEVGAIDSYSCNLFLGSYATGPPVGHHPGSPPAPMCFSLTIDGENRTRATPSIMRVFGWGRQGGREGITGREGIIVSLGATSRILTYGIDYNLRSPRYRDDYVAKPASAALEIRVLYDRARPPPMIFPILHAPRALLAHARLFPLRRSQRIAKSRGLIIAMRLI